jgi:hypothetical protein
MKITLDQKRTLENIITRYESLELAIVQKSDHYPGAHFRSSIFWSLSASMILYFIPWNFHDPIWYLYIQIPALIFGYLLAGHPKVKRLFSTSSEMKEETYQKALEYYHRNFNDTDKELLFVSLLEKRVEFITFQEEQEDKVKQIKELTRLIKKEGVFTGLESSLEKLVSLKNEGSDSRLDLES